MTPCPGSGGWQGTLAMTVFYLSLTLAMALANPEGLTIVLLLLNTWVATGLGLGCAPLKYPHPVVLVFGLGSLGLSAGVFASLVRGASRARPK